MTDASWTSYGTFDCGKLSFPNEKLESMYSESLPLRHHSLLMSGGEFFGNTAMPTVVRECP